MLDLSKFVTSLDNKAVYIYGLGKSGLASVEALVKSGAHVMAWDGKEAARDAAKETGAEVVGEEEADFSNIACVLLSPGVPFTHPEPHPVVLKAQAHHVEVIGDIEVFGRSLPKDIKTIGITGTNGKSTTTSLLGHILQECGVKALVGGNIGMPVLSFDLEEDTEVVVLELSSYQLDLCTSFHPDIGILLNITPDHIDRHGSLTQYAAVKARIFGHLTRPIISTDDELCREIFEVEAELGKAPIELSLKGKLPFDTSDLKTLAGAHNHQNALAAWHACLQLGLRESDILSAMKTFPGLAHRQQIVRQIGNISFVNDSKATNAQAAAKALGTYKNIFWIVGGQTKEGGLEGLQEFIPNISKVYLIGEAAEEFAGWLGARGVKYEMAGTLEKAVPQAYRDAKNQEQEGGLVAAGAYEDALWASAEANSAVVLLSPACASWDQFKSFEERGEVFVEVVSGLKA